jgi:hypothetical protein
MVAAFEECQDRPDAVMEVFGRKMGEMMLQQKQAQESVTGQQPQKPAPPHACGATVLIRIVVIVEAWCLEK